MRGPLLWLGFCASQRVSDCNSSCVCPRLPPLPSASSSPCLCLLLCSALLCFGLVCGNVLGDIVNIFLETGIAVRRTRLAGRAKKRKIHTRTHTDKDTGAAAAAAAKAKSGPGDGRRGKGASWQTGTCYVDRARNASRRSFWH